MKYQLVDYFDVWGNQEDGWEVNNLCKVGDPIIVTDDATDLDIINYLKQINFLGDNADEESVRIEWWDEFAIELFERETDLPLCKLERVQ